VIACPPTSESFSGADIYSSLRMPSGIAPAVVLEPANAVLLAAKILAISDPELKAAVVCYQQRKAETVIADDQALTAH
jgi:5-(carboxyamino)imidazole ribonucleotide mutase/phosphoribosylaminoimidazole-succinocarboxamide synthase